MVDNRRILTAPAGREMLAGRLPVREAGVDGVESDVDAEIQSALDVLFMDAHWNQGLPPVAAVDAASALSGPVGAALSGQIGEQAKASAREFIAAVRADVLASTARQARAALPLDIGADLDSDSGPRGCF